MISTETETKPKKRTHKDALPDLRPHEYVSSNALIPSSKAAELTTAVWKSSFLVGLLRLGLSAQESLMSTGGPLIRSSCACSDIFGQGLILDRERCPPYITGGNSSILIGIQQHPHLRRLLRELKSRRILDTEGMLVANLRTVNLDFRSA